MKGFETFVTRHITIGQIPPHQGPDQLLEEGVFSFLESVVEQQLQGGLGVGADIVRPALHLVQRRLDLKPVLSLRARVASVRTLRPGERAGYGLAFQARQETRLAVVTIGYADGLPRQLPQQGGRVLIRGAFCPMAGRMCMDQLLVDVTALPGVQAGDVVTLIGRDGAQELRAEELAARCGTITNELLSRLGRRLELQKVPRSSQSSGRSAETRG